MRGQSAFEFTVLMAFGMLLMMILLTVGVYYSSDHVENQRLQEMLGLGYSLQDEIILATTVQEGYERDLDLPTRLGRFTYDITTETNIITISSAKQTVQFRIPAVTGSFQKGNNTLQYTTDGELRII